MPLFLAALWGTLATVLGSLVGRVLLALGLTFVAFKGINVVISGAETLIKSSIGGLPGDTVAFLAFAGIDRALSLIFSAMAVSVLIKGLAGATATRMVSK